VVALLGLAALACGGGAGDSRDPDALAVGGHGNLTVVLPADGPTFLAMAAQDLLEVVARRTGAEPGPDLVFSQGDFDPSHASTGIVVLAGVAAPDGTPAAPDAAQDRSGGQAYRVVGQSRQGRTVLFVRGSGALGTAYGLYEVAQQLGARWYHPSEEFVPRDPGARLPAELASGVDRQPAARLRGFHQHTQHPIPWAEYLLKADPANRAPITAYLRWLLRNRQNLLEWHMLSTVDRSTWDDHCRWMVEEAHRHGVRLGMVVSFSDLQQNAYRLITDLAQEQPLEARIATQREQVRAGLGSLHPLGLDLLVFQFGTTEMSKVGDSETLAWFDDVSEWRAANAPSLETFAWVHTPTSLLADDGVTPFFHLPLQGPPDLGLYVHTTMFYDLTHPAPVYNNADFHHQQACFTQGAGVRPLAYFPETAWWLGFDNTLPLFLPITNYSRGWDLAQAIPPLLGDQALDGHVTFTTGIEWGYWMFDHYVARLTWEPGLDWKGYAADVAGLYGGAAQAVQEALVALTERQVQDFYGDNPLIFFYLAGESQGDEGGAASGLAARPVKIPFWDVYRFNQAGFDAWQAGDQAQLLAIRDAYQAIADKLDAADPGTDPTDPLLADRFFELRSAVDLTAWRAAHAGLQYGAVVDARNQDEAAAYAKLAASRAITADVKARVAEVEARVYRDPLALVAEEKPDSLTSYPFGYAWETRTAHFWARRDEQLQGLLDVVFGKVAEEWDLPVERLLGSVKDSTQVLEPDVGAGTKGLIRGYIPTLLVALGPESGGVRPAALAADVQGNGQPDVGTQVAGSWDDHAPLQTIAFAEFPVPVGSASSLLGTLVVRGGSLQVQTGEVDHGRAELAGRVRFQDLLDILVATGMFDAEKAWKLVAQQFGIDPQAEPRPVDFPLRVTTVLEDRT
jgi:hypothetical protein